MIINRAFPNNAAVFATVTLFNRYFVKSNDNNGSDDCQLIVNYIPESPEIATLKNYLFLPDLFL